MGDEQEKLLDEALGIVKVICILSVCQILQTGPYLKKDGRKTGVFLTKIRALDGRKDGRRRAKFKFLFYAIFMQFTEVKLH